MWHLGLDYKEWDFGHLTGRSISTVTSVVKCGLFDTCCCTSTCASTEMTIL